MELSKYLEFVKQATHTEVHPDDLAFYYELGWQGELGEIRQLLSKALRVVRSDQPLPDEFWERLVDECGDALFYQLGWWAMEEVFDPAYGWDECSSSVELIRRNDSIARINVIVSFCSISETIFLPNDHSPADLATANHSKLVKRKAESGSYAKRL